MINQVVAGVRETFADSGIDQAVLIRSILNVGHFFSHLGGGLKLTEIHLLFHLF